jgi:hypothetical protein
MTAAQKLWQARATDPLSTIAKHKQIKAMVWKDSNQKTIPQPGWFSDPSLSVHGPTAYRAYFLAGYPSTSDAFWKGVLTTDSFANNKRDSPDTAAVAPPPAKVQHAATTNTDFPLHKTDFLGTKGFMD